MPRLQELRASYIAYICTLVAKASYVLVPELAISAHQRAAVRVLAGLRRQLPLVLMHAGPINLIPIHCAYVGQADLHNYR